MKLLLFIQNWMYEGMRTPENVPDQGLFGDIFVYVGMAITIWWIWMLLKEK